MNRSSRALLAAVPFLLVGNPARAETNLVVRSDGDCPSGQAVREALWAICPDREWPALTATVRVIEDRIQVSLQEDRARWRDVPAPADCADRASRAALVIAVWSGQLPTHAAGAPILSVATPAPEPISPAMPEKSAMVTELGVSGFYSTVGGWVPGARVEAGRFRREGWWGIRAAVAYQSAKSLYVDIGTSRYDRALLGAALALQWGPRRLFLSSDWGLVGAYTRAHGEGYSQDESASGLNVGLAADGRVGLRVGSFLLWADGTLYRWARKETILVDPLATGTSSTSTLPAWDAHVGLGAGVVFD